MTKAFYPRLAWDGIRKNARLYIPYLLSCSCMIMMNYIILYLSDGPFLDGMSGMQTARAVLTLGSWVITVFSVIFLFYTNSFLIRRRLKEFGLYNILGMERRNIGHILFWDALFCAGISSALGLIAGVVFSKLAELCFLNLMHLDISYTLYISAPAIIKTICTYAVIFALLFLNSLIRVGSTQSVNLLKSENLGERPPKGNIVIGILGLAALTAAYVIAVRVQSPLSALLLFFAAVLMVIAATYALFISGSVVFCRLLQRKKSYYYKPQHFVSVSSMVYRMKRNGAGLASICILVTMVLVMISGSACLFFGEEGALREQFPMDFSVRLTFVDPESCCDENYQTADADIREVFAQENCQITDTFFYRYAYISGIVGENGQLIYDHESVESFGIDTYEWLREFNFYSIEDYNRYTDTPCDLADDEVLITGIRCTYPYDTITILDKTYRVISAEKTILTEHRMFSDIVPSFCIILPDWESEMQGFAAHREDADAYWMYYKWIMDYDLDADEEEQIRLDSVLYDHLKDQMLGEGALQLTDGSEITGVQVESIAPMRADFYETYGGLFFLGIMLSIVFLFAAVLIIYYKQISEGYEDQGRFAIMQKIGMTKEDIRKSINSQMLTVFLLPLVFAVLHLTFAFPMIEKLLLLFGVGDTMLLFLIAGISVLIFGIFYTVVYLATSEAYYRIVSDARS